MLKRDAVEMESLKGQYHVARAFEVAAAGKHNILLIGPSGVGKAFLARMLPGLIPGDPSLFEFSSEFIPKEVPSEATSGIVLLRDLQDYKVWDLRKVWQQRPPLQYIATIQPCPCGFFGDKYHECTCKVGTIQYFYKSRAEFLRDFDLYIEVSAIEPKHLFDKRPGERSALVRMRVEEAHEAQERRGAMNGSIDNLTLLDTLDVIPQKLLDAAVKQLHLTPFDVVKILRLSQTISDLAGEKAGILTNHLAEAIQYRPRFQVR
jgi:magnesium chelatase family protein